MERKRRTLLFALFAMVTSSFCFETAIGQSAVDENGLAPDGASFPVWIEPDPVAQPERDVANFDAPIVTFSLRSRSAVRIDAAVESQSLMRMAIEAGAILNEATLEGMERQPLVGQAIPKAYCTPNGALRDILGHRRWRACLVDADNDGRFDEWIDGACSADEVASCESVPPLTMLTAMPSLRTLKTPIPYSRLPDDQAPSYPMALMLAHAPGGGVELAAIDRNATGVQEVTADDVEAIPPAGMTLTAYGLHVEVTRIANGQFHLKIIDNMQRQPAFVQTNFRNFPRSVRRAIVVAPN